MKLKTLSLRLELVLIGMALCGLVVYGCFFPWLGRCIVLNAPEFAYCYYPWLILLWVTALPCYAALLLGWKIARNIGKDRAFTEETAKLLRWIARLAACDAGFFFLMNLVYLFLNMNHPGIVLVSLLIACAGAAVSVVCAGLSDLVKRAWKLQEQYDLTI